VSRRKEEISKIMVFKELMVDTDSKVSLVDITDKISGLLQETGIEDGVCHIFIPHTTAAITINENADPTVRQDIIETLERLIPQSFPYKHLEGNSPAHIKASIIGSSRTVFIRDGRLCLGTWQGIFLCEFDGPRRRRVWVELLRS
jgi:secondary thiamine-phosphate synthase enzyme